jgi:hypothetical protein
MNMTPEGTQRTVAKADVDDRQRGASAMPEDLVTKLTLAEIRDLVEFMAGSR